MNVLLLIALSAAAEVATVKLKATSEGSMISGTVTLTDTKKGLKISAVLQGLPPGEHGFHIHEFGSCEEAGKAAGSHYNPHQAMHGDAMKAGIKKAHAGDMGNLIADASGKAVLEVVIEKLTLTGGKHSAAGRSLIVHEKPDDFSQPTGNAGGRIACGVIGITSPQ